MAAADASMIEHVDVKMRRRKTEETSRWSTQMWQRKMRHVENELKKAAGGFRECRKVHWGSAAEDGSGALEIVTCEVTPHGHDLLRKAQDAPQIHNTIRKYVRLPI